MGQPVYRIGNRNQADIEFLHNLLPVMSLTRSQHTFHELRGDVVIDLIRKL